MQSIIVGYVERLNARLAADGHASIASATKEQLASLTPVSLCRLREAALDLARIVEIELDRQSTVQDQIEQFEREGHRFDPNGPAVVECPGCSTLTQFASDHRCNFTDGEDHDAGRTE